MTEAPGNLPRFLSHLFFKNSGWLHVFFVTAQQSCTKSNIRQALTIFVKFGRLVVRFDTNKDYL